MKGENIENFRDRNLVFVDIETTGLDPEIHEIIEVAGVVVDGRSFNQKDEYEIKVFPEHIDTADTQALLITGYSEERWTNAMRLKEALQEFNTIAKGGILIGWNSAFDISFIKKNFSLNHNQPLFDYHYLDVMTIVYAYFYHNDEVKELGLRKTAPYFNLSLDETHTALEDATATYKIFKEIMTSDRLI